MPFLRVLRDKRGYETTYLMHWFREGSRQRSRILYVFRTPPGVRVGRDPLDPQVIREIQAKYPDIEFDWRALRENQQVVETSPEPRRPRPAARSGRPEPVEGRGKRRKEEDATQEMPGSGRVTPEASQPASLAGPEAAPQRPPIPATIQGTTREEQFVFLLNVYLDLRERVPHRTQDPIRRETLLGLVERLNPEAWVGEEQIVAGFEHAADALQRLSHIFAKRRKRARRSKTDRVKPERVMTASEVSEPSEPSEPSDPSDPSDPSEPFESFEPSEPSEPPEPSEPREPSE